MQVRDGLPYVTITLYATPCSINATAVRYRSSRLPGSQKQAALDTAHKSSILGTLKPSEVEWSYESEPQKAHATDRVFCTP